MSNTTKMISPARRYLLYCRILVCIAGFLPRLLKSGNLNGIMKALISGYPRIKPFLFPRKVWRIGGKYYWSLYVPGFPSPPFRQVAAMEVNRMLKKGNKGSLGTLIFAITRKCPLDCEHCFEWKELNTKEVLDEQRICSILDSRLDSGGIGQLVFSGGEPLTRYPLMKNLAHRYGDRCNLWVATSGLGLSPARARELKQAGLTGVMISLDHYEPSEHDRFRGFRDAWRHAVDAAKNAEAAGLVTALSVCMVRETATPYFLEQYLLLARSLGVQFVQLVEPRSEGRYHLKDVELGDRARDILEAFCNKYNHQPEYAGYPQIMYPDHNRRKYGCLAGEMSAYIDTKGEEHPCPFCKGPGQQCAVARPHRHAEPAHVH